MQFGNTLFAINIDIGCLHVRDITDVSCYPHEEEWLFSPYSLFQVVEHNDTATILTSHDNMQDLGMDTEDPKNDESVTMETSSSSDASDIVDFDDVGATAATTCPFPDQQFSWDSNKKKKKHKKKCSIQ